MTAHTKVLSYRLVIRPRLAFCTRMLLGKPSFYRWSGSSSRRATVEMLRSAPWTPSPFPSAVGLRFHLLEQSGSSSEAVWKAKSFIPLDELDGELPRH